MSSLQSHGLATKINNGVLIWDLIITKIMEIIGIIMTIKIISTCLRERFISSNTIKVAFSMSRLLKLL